MIKNYKDEQDVFYISVGKVLKKYRKKKNLSMAKVAEYFDVSHQQINKFEMASAKIPLYVFKKLCDLYEINSSIILDEKFEDFSADELDILINFKNLECKVQKAIIALIDNLLD